MINDRPKARTDDVIAERVDDELVIYDQQTQTGHCLSAEAARVWERCDGIDSQAEIARELGLDPAVVERAVAELAQASLLAAETVAEREYSRRDAAKKLAKVGAVALAAPMVYSVAIGPATAAASTKSCSMVGCTGSSAIDGTSGDAQADANRVCRRNTVACTSSSTCACQSITCSGLDIGGFCVAGVWTCNMGACVY